MSDAEWGFDLGNENDIVHIGNHETWGASSPFGIKTADRRQHVHIIGKTGTGKTTLLRNLICQDIEAGRGVGVIDPHGDAAGEKFAESFLRQISPHRFVRWVKLEKDKQPTDLAVAQLKTRFTP